MMVIRFFHAENKLQVGTDEYKATCDVRNEINKKRKPSQVVETYPITSSLGRRPYMPRKFPTGLWKVKPPIWTHDPEYWPVKIPTDAVQRVLTWCIDGDNRYISPDGCHQDDAFYHLHYCRGSKTTLGCIRLNSEYDAIAIARKIESCFDKGEEVWIEVFANMK